MSGTPNYLKAGDINMSTRSCEIVDYLKALVMFVPIKSKCLGILRDRG